VQQVKASPSFSILSAGNNMPNKTFIPHFPILLLSVSLFWSASAELTADDDVSMDKTWQQAFELQGEYTGNIKLAGQYQSLGLQLVAKADQKFVASLYRGGLPGAGAAKTFDLWKGEIVDGRLVLRSEDPRADRIEQRRPGQTDLEYIDANGNRAGTFYRIERVSPTLNLTPPANALVLFDGISANQLVDAKINERGNLGVGFSTDFDVQDFRLHVEFRTPFMPDKEGQQRGNSGVYIQRRYEVQILDSFGTKGEFNECGALYRQRKPDLNMALPPGQWQTYDIKFTAARFDSQNNKTAKARLTAMLNGVAVQDDVEIESKTGAGKPEGPEAMPILFQNHGDAVEFRNVWLVKESHVPMAAPENAWIEMAVAQPCGPVSMGPAYVACVDGGIGQVGTVCISQTACSVRPPCCARRLCCWRRR
jgi:hypothetical protein